ncbi:MULTISPECIES: TetR/AcrR family transcriptional regulator [Staphylococcus]|uniref:HTH tetR-type domain-containing protein n=1 Tax=Staphylococcus haemolyticus TaxID=1283 RepID=A0A060PWN5_STAHA|nr:MULTISPECIES: TetR/AcrR family transcriptional regulator [Staphylococcus]AYY66228.1 TetR/AcrR family transcriptional regulator [Staphylococcus hominis]CAC5514077.1 TetR family transcriptional regulator [Staphylococcus aureus]CXF20484.1 TetR family transcriptional regulator [Staphylococcus aureus]CXQ00286.1 TetR family transcriptional regulator [Staphylococcus aureus]CXR40624.1 TetR family transcriptional regulator [Staphylococcus aureus]
MNEELIMDARIIKTKRNTLNALKRLLKRKKFADISVKDICIEGNVSRGTFYLHYKDKYDLVYKYQIEIMKKIQPILESVNYLSLEEFFAKAIHFWSNDAELLMLLISDNGSTDIQNQVKRLIQQNAKKNILPIINTNNYSEIEKHYLTIFLSNAIFGIIQEWINNGQKESPDELSAILSKIAPKHLFYKE